MKRHMSWAYGVALTIAGLGGDAVAQPRVIEIPRERLPYVPPVPDWQSEEIRNRLKDEVEMIDIQLATRKVYLKNAEVKLAAAKLKLADTDVSNNAVAATDVRDAKVAVALAQSEVDVRTAELNEWEFRAKVAKRRLDSGVYPLILTPVPSQSVFPPTFADRRTNDDKASLADRARDRLVDVEQASNAVALARTEYDRVKVRFERNAATQSERDAAAAKLDAVRIALRKAVKESAAADDELRKSLTPPIGIALPPEK